jgi:hypothetical protein
MPPLRKEADYHALAARRGYKWIGEFPANTKTPTLWRCEQGHEWRSRFFSINEGDSCPVCAGKQKKTAEDYRALASANNLEWIGAYPQRTHFKTDWRCHCGHEWSSSYNMVQQGRLCPRCGGKAPRLESDYFALAATRGLEFLGPVPRYVVDKTNWKCKSGHIWSTSYHTIQKGWNCPHCSRRRKLTADDYHDIARLREMEWIGALPKNAGLKTRWRCKNGHEIEVPYKDIYKHGGCALCVDMVNGSRVSNPQRQIAAMLNAELNYRIGRKAIDAAMVRNGVKIAIEYDCWYWHKDHQERDERRVQWLISQGWRVLSIKANTNLPDLAALEWAIQQLVDGKDRIDLYLEDWGGDTLDLLS